MLFIDDTFEQEAPEKNKIILNLGCGVKTESGWINCDIEDGYGKAHSDGNRYYKHPDILLDLDNSLPFKNESVDIVILTKVMAHVKHPIKLRKEVDRILKYGGKMITYRCVNCDHSDSKFNTDHSYTKGMSEDEIRKLFKIQGA